MRVFLDECVDWRLSRDLIGHQVMTARQMGWVSIENGELLARASQAFDVFITVDRNGISAESRCTSDPGHHPAGTNEPARRP